MTLAVHLALFISSVIEAESIMCTFPATIVIIPVHLFLLTHLPYLTLPLPSPLTASFPPQLFLPPFSITTPSVSPLPVSSFFRRYGTSTSSDTSRV